MNRLEELLKMNHVKEKETPSLIEISREDFDILDIEQDVMYRIIEEDGTITMKKGVNR